MVTSSIIPINTISTIRTNFRSINNKELTSADKITMVNQIKDNICDAINNNPDNQDKIINTYKLIIKETQENLNNKGTSSFHDNAYYGDIDNALYTQIMHNDNEQLNMIQCICTHSRTAVNNRKFSFWRTNYTNAADKLRDFLKNPIAITDVIDNMNSLLQRGVNDAIGQSISNYEQEQITIKSIAENEKRTILQCTQVTINQRTQNCTINEYKHERSTYVLANINQNTNQFLYRKPIYEIVDATNKRVYTGPLQYNTTRSCVEPAIVVDASKIKVVFSLGTSITQEQKASTLVSVFDRLHLNNNQKIIINGVGSNMRNPIKALTGQIGGYGIHKNVNDGVNFMLEMESIELVISFGFIRGGITAIAQINNAMVERTDNLPEFHVCIIDPVAGALFDTYQKWGNPTANLARQTKQLNEKNIIGGTVLYQLHYKARCCIILY